MTEKFILFGLLTIPLIIISSRTLFNIKSHGFYRFFAWECILWLGINNYKIWFIKPFSLMQLFSWIILISSFIVFMFGALALINKGKLSDDRYDKALFKIEKTTQLVESGIFKYIRHPIYFSLILLTWGVFLKNINYELLLISVISTILLFFTAWFDEKECIIYFGDIYRQYMTKTKMFIPFIL